MVPLLWRRAECVAALSRAHAKAIICCGRVGDFDHGQLALDVAAELFPIRAVCGFGRGLPDGIVAIDEIADTTETADRIETFPDIAAITFDMGTDGPVPVERDAVQLLSAGLLVGSQAGVSRGAAILSTVPISSYAGLSASLLPWLMSAGNSIFRSRPKSCRARSKAVTFWWYPMRWPCAWPRYLFRAHTACEP